MLQSGTEYMLPAVHKCVILFMEVGWSQEAYRIEQDG